MKKNFAIVISLIFIFSILFNNQVYADQNETYSALQIDNTNFSYRRWGRPVGFRELAEGENVSPFIYNGSVMLPMRAVIEIIPVDGPPAFRVEWHDSERRAVIVASGLDGVVPLAEFWIGRTTAVYYDDYGRNPRQVTIANAPVIINGRTYLPLRAVVDAFSSREIEWVPSKQGIVVYWTGLRPQTVTFPDRSTIEF